jgi:hypothetical protein
MTLAEFKAWLEGFSESFGEAPSAEQWAKIKAKIASTEAFVSKPVVVPTVWAGQMGGSLSPGDNWRLHAAQNNQTITSS